MKRIWIPQTIIIPMLLWALYPNPYGYYVFLRIICCATFAYLLSQAFVQENNRWAWGFGIIAVVYNPLIPIHLNREIWSVLNLATIGIAVASIFVLKFKTQNPAPPSITPLSNKKHETFTSFEQGRDDLVEEMLFRSAEMSEDAYRRITDYTDLIAETKTPEEFEATKSVILDDYEQRKYGPKNECSGEVSAEEGKVINIMLSSALILTKAHKKHTKATGSRFNY